LNLFLNLLFKNFNKVNLFPIIYNIAMHNDNTHIMKKLKNLFLSNEQIKLLDNCITHNKTIYRDD